jgi:GxxExxY protein
MCLCHELQALGLSHVSEKILPVEYDGLTIELGRRIDILVEDTVVVEVKSLGAILPIHEAQLLTYLRLARKRVGLVINFNVEQLKDGIRRKVIGLLRIRCDRRRAAALG